MTRAVVYDHFASKKDLYVAVLGEQGALFLGHLETRIVSEGPVPREAVLDAGMALMWDGLGHLGRP